MAAGLLTCGSARDVRVFPSHEATVTGDRCRAARPIAEGERALPAYSGETVWVLHPASLTARVGVGL